jgi:hypothetical protein
MRKAIAAASVVVLAACSATMVKSAGPSGSAYAPVNEKDSHGIVSYLNDGAETVRKKRREDAYRKMYESCAGPYRIVTEGEKVEGGSVVKVDPNVTSFFSFHDWYIEYACQPKADSTASRPDQ